MIFLTAAPAAARSHASNGLRPSAVERLSADRAGSPGAKGLRAGAAERLRADGARSPGAKGLCADAAERLEESPLAERRSRTDAAERRGRPQAAHERSQRGRRNRTNQSSLGQQSRHCVAIERLSSRRSAACRINAFERRLAASEAGLDAGG
jgi:hypothetical protein